MSAVTVYNDKDLEEEVSGEVEFDVAEPSSENNRTLYLKNELSKEVTLKEYDVFSNADVSVSKVSSLEPNEVAELKISFDLPLDRTKPVKIDLGFKVSYINR